MKKLRCAVEKNLQWFIDSGVMIPENGLWGVAERLAVKNNNNALTKVLEAFPAWTEREWSYVIEQRRADCNFQTAWLFLTADRMFPGKNYGVIGRNILDFLYFRSGLLERSRNPHAAIYASWNWSHIKRESVVYYDDEAWCIVIQLRIAEAFPELEKRYQMRYWALELAEQLYAAVTDPENKACWRGTLAEPHWGALAAMALAQAAGGETREKYLKFCREYFENISCPNVSEESYALLGAVNCALKLDREIFLPLAEAHARNILVKLDPETGLPPSEHSRETPAGKHLADLIYTINWAVIGLLELGRVAGEEYSSAAVKMADFLCEIQDDSESPDFCGCWRGMYDIPAGGWGGGDLYEGGGNSIYTGWTNAPIALALSGIITGKSLFI